MAPALQLFILLGTWSLIEGNVISSTKPTPPGAFELLILHNNDMHARFEQTSQLSGVCNTEDREAGKCYGGFPRVAYVVKEAREKAKTGEGPPVLYLNAGDTYTGTAWFTIYKWKIAAECLNALNPDAVSLSNGELEEEISATSQHLKDIQSPILAANIKVNYNEENQLILNSVIFDIDGVKVCLIGYVKPVEVKYPKVEYIDEVIAIQKEINKNLLNGVNIFIAIGHSNNNKHIDIAKNVVGLDIVIANTPPTDVTRNASNYITIKQSNGMEVLVVNSYDFSKYVGKLELYFDNIGNIIGQKVERITLDETIVQDKDALNILSNITSDKDNIILGQTTVVLNGEACNEEECNLGNFIADSFIYYYAVQFQGQDWTDASIAVIPSTNIASSVLDTDRPSHLTVNDVTNILPNKDKIIVVTMPGLILLKLLEEAVYNFTSINSTHTFLQFSGIIVTYDLLRPPGKRVVSAMVRCSACKIPQFFEIDERQYKVLMPKSLSKNDLIANLEQTQLVYDEATCLKRYIQDRSPIYPDVSDRITLQNSFNRAIGKTSVILDGESCSTQECNLGNLITDSMIYYYAIRHSGEHWTDASIAIINSGSIASLNVFSNRPSEITLTDLMKVLPNSETITLVTMSGSILLKLLEESVFNFNQSNFSNMFLQYSGIRITYDLSKTPGSRILSTTVRCSSCNIPQFFDIDDRLYKVLMPTALAKHNLFDGLEKETLLYNEITCLKEYIEHKSPIYPDVPGRISFFNGLPGNVIIGKTAVKLSGNTCSVEECNLGNLITDAIIYLYAVKFAGERWTDSPIAIINSGAIGTSISHTDLSLDDINNMFTKKENIVAVSITGSVLLKLLELSVTDSLTSQLFLQYSGIRILYDLSRPSGSRIVNAAARCWDCMVPELYKIDDRIYKILMPKSLSEHELLINYVRGELNFGGATCVKEYVQRRSPIYPDVSGRITIANEPHDSNVIIGKTAVRLDSKTCNVEECNMGNLITDAIIYHYAVKFTGERWTDSPIAIINSGAIGTSISHTDLSLDDINNIFTNKEKIMAVSITGSLLLKFLELSVTNSWTSQLFLQYSGIRISYDLSRPSGSRIVSAAARCWDCMVPELYEIDDRVYKILMPKSLSEHELLINSVREELNFEGITCVKEYVQQRSPIYPDVSGRITIVNKPHDPNAIIGKTAVRLDSETCNVEECNLGNLITDAIIYHYAVKFTGERWTDSPIAIINSDAIGTSIPHTDLSLDDINNIFTNKENIVAVSITGSVLLKLLELSVTDGLTSQIFLQYSGIRILYDLSRPSGSRIVSAAARCWDCMVPEFYEIDNRLYRILIPKSLSEHELLINSVREELNFGGITCVKEYVQQRSPIYPDVSGRITVVNKPHDPNVIIGKTAVRLDSKTCNVEECNLGNLITDAIIYHYAVKFTGKQWTDSPIAIINSGAIGNIISHPELTVDYINNIFTSSENIVAVSMAGSVLLQLLELSVSNSSTSQLFLQYSGIRISYNLSKPPGSRIVNAAARCWDCMVPELYEIDDRTYKILMPKLLSEHELLTNSIREELYFNGVTCIKEYIQRRSPIYPDVSGRIVFIESNDVESTSTSSTIDLPTTTTSLPTSTTDLPITRTDLPTTITNIPTTITNLPTTITESMTTPVNEPIDSTTTIDESTTTTTNDDQTTTTDSAIEIKPSITILLIVFTLVNIDFSLGNHEFDEGVNGLIPFLQNVTFPNLAANLILDKEPELKNEKNLVKSIIIKIDNVDVGIIGYLTPDTKILAIKNNVEYVDEVVAIREEAAKLKQRGVNILIALGHSGFTKDKEIAREVEDIDLVIGGHTNTFLWNGDVPDVEKPEGPYPKLIKQKSGRIVPAVQAYAYTKYLGKLHLVFDSDGELLNHTGNPILLSYRIPEDVEMLQIVDKYRESVMKISEEVIGYSLINLDARSCRFEECNIGNLVADAMVNLYALLHNGTRWTDAPIAIIQGGGIRTSIAHTGMHFNVTKGELLAVLPFGGKLVKITMKGDVLLKMLEHSIAYYNPIRASGQFLQFSGIKVTYDVKRKRGSRVVNAAIRCSECDIPRYEPLDKNKEYNVLMSNFIAQGGDGYSMFEELPTTSLEYNDLDCAIQYIQMYSPIHPEIENRIILLNAGSIKFLSLSVIFVSLIRLLL